MAMNDLMLAKHGTNATAVPSILQNKLRLLVDADEFAQAEEVAEQYLPLIATRRDSILRYMTHQEALVTKRVFWPYCRALAGQKKPEKLAGFVQQILLDYPALLDERQQYPTPGWLYDQLVQALIDQNKLDEALQWGKARFALCAFDTPSIERSTKTLASIWMARDLSLAAANAFAEAQKDAAKENPLAAVRFPEVDREKLKPLIDALSPGKPNELHDRVSLLVLAGREHQAMVEARQMLLSSPKAPDGSQQICRILKAADGSVRRAYAFIEYVTTGAGENPVAQFLKEHPAPEEAAKP